MYPNEWDNVNQCIVIDEGNEQRAVFLKKIRKKISSRHSLVINIIHNFKEQGYYNVDDIMVKYLMITDNGFLHNYAEKLVKELESTRQK